MDSGGSGTLHIKQKKTLTLKSKPAPVSLVRQSFGHGRSKSVIVETRKRPVSVKRSSVNRIAEAGSLPAVSQVLDCDKEAVSRQDDTAVAVDSLVTLHSTDQEARPAIETSDLSHQASSAPVPDLPGVDVPSSSSASPDEPAEISEAINISEPVELSEATNISEPSELSEATKTSEPAELSEAIKTSEPAELSEAIKTSEPAELSEAINISELTKISEPIKISKPARVSEATKMSEASSDASLGVSQDDVSVKRKPVLPAPGRPFSRIGVAPRGLSKQEELARTAALSEAKQGVISGLVSAQLREQWQADYGPDKTNSSQKQVEEEPVLTEEQTLDKDTSKPDELDETSKQDETAASTEDTTDPTPSRSRDSEDANGEASEGDSGRRKGKRSGSRSAAPKKSALSGSPRTARTADGSDRSRATTLIPGEEDDGPRSHSVAAFKRRVKKQQRKGVTTGEREKVARDLTIPETITVQELANRMAERSSDVIRFLMKQGHMVKSEDVIEGDTAQLIAEEMGHNVRRFSEADIEANLFGNHCDNPASMSPRPPVVTIMGHVDHGKTSLLDAIRSAKIAGEEAGGITQHIGAYQVDFKDSKITFIDTPGHQAFTEMRSRGAKVTDIVILVVSADSQVMPTTVEAINHTRAAGVPIIVAINKIDRPNADPGRIRNELLAYDVTVESMGGEVLEIEISAKYGTNIPALMDAILLQAEMQNLVTNSNCPAEGTVIEAGIDKGRGCVATLLVQCGTLKRGDLLVAGTARGRVRAMINDSGGGVQEAAPAMPVEILGFQSPPEAGDRFVVVNCESRARGLVDYRVRLKNERLHSHRSLMRGSSLSNLTSQFSKDQSDSRVLTVIIKADVHGSLEAISGVLESIGNEEVSIQRIHAGVGDVTESDVALAIASRALIIGFNVSASKQVRELSSRESVEIRHYCVIYDLVNDMKKTMGAMLSPGIREMALGVARVCRVFDITKVGKVAGCLVIDGKLERSASVRVVRDGVVVYQGDLTRLKRFKDEVQDAVSGQECGVALAGYQDVRDGDFLECYRVESVVRGL